MISTDVINSFVGPSLLGVREMNVCISYVHSMLRFLSLGLSIPGEGASIDIYIKCQASLYYSNKQHGSHAYSQESRNCSVLAPCWDRFACLNLPELLIDSLPWLIWSLKASLQSCKNCCSARHLISSSSREKFS